MNNFVKPIGVKFNVPTLITVTAPTCSGKSTLVNVLTKDGHYERVVGTTTRAPREGEVQGLDYNFLTVERSRQMAEAGLFAELIEFQGIQYGVTHEEMGKKMKGSTAPIVILTPHGLEAYEQLCEERGWHIFRVFIYTREETRIERLNARTKADLLQMSLRGVAGASIEPQIDQLVNAHTKRLLSITNDERTWSHKRRWDVLLPGDDLEKAVRDLENAIQLRNKRAWLTQ